MIRTEGIIKPDGQKQYARHDGSIIPNHFCDSSKNCVFYYFKLIPLLYGSCPNFT